jgi:hypothetical protein
MQPNRVVSMDGGSTLSYWSTVADVPALAVIPLPAYGMGMTPSDANQIYQLALERAWAAVRPSIWSLAQRVCLN